MAKFPRVFLAIATIGISAAAATPSTAATDGHSIPWSSLGVVRPILTQPAGWGSPIAAQPNSATSGWCSKNGVEIASGSGKATLVPDNSVGNMLKSSHLGMVGSPGGSKIVVTCDSVALDPSHPKTVYAGFEASEGGSIPPVYNVALVTANVGKSWRFVPPPHGYSLADFAGFVERQQGVQVLYSHNYYSAPKAGHFAFFVSATSSTGGRTWIHQNLDCTGFTPCVIFGPQAPQGACGMSSWQQSVFVGDLEELTGSDIWRTAGSVPSVSQCGSQQLIATKSGDVFMVDRSRANALLFTRDGVHWNTVLLPKINGVSVGGTFAPFGQIMTLAANGDLLAVAGSPLETAEHLEILEPGSKAWCAANATLPTGTKKDTVAATQSSKSKLVVSFFAPIRTASGKVTSALTFPLSTLHCRL